ncbi:MAG: hypothetical protein HW387_843 [Parachlamydiales bacterium]|nr:hypothetical protein [Parachlamydiales bacterium]
MSEPWFKEGLRFKCTGCGKCCTGSDGYVYLSPQDLFSLSSHLDISIQEFIDRYTRIVDGHLCLLDAPGSDKCIFLKDNRCVAYESRPIQCQAFPWWLHTLKTPENWRDAAQNCEGINHPDAPLIEGTKIAQQCMRYIDNLIEQNNDIDYTQ